MRRDEAEWGARPGPEAGPGLEAGPDLESLRGFGAALLAGGEGRRLGGLSKEALVGPEGPLGPALAERLGAFFGEVLVVTKRPELYAAPRRGSAKGGAFATCADLRPGFGPLSGLHAALSKAGSPWVYLAACDMPAFSPAFAAHLAARIRRAEAAAGAGGEAPLAALARYGEHFEPFHAFYSRALLPRLEALLARSEGAGEGRRPSFKELFAERPVLYLPEAEARAFSPDWGLFFNINRPEDLARFRGLAD